MVPPAERRCRQCANVILEGETLCARCLLQSVQGETPRVREERLFAQVLALDPSARLAFIAESAREAPELGDSLRMLLQGYYETEGDPKQFGIQPGLLSSAVEDTQPSSMDSETPGAHVGHFRLVRLIGEGGMGSVWEAEQESPLRRTVALKLIKLGMDTREVVKRFQRERQTLAQLAHPNIAQLYEAGATVLGRPYFVMEWVDGDPLTQWCGTHRLDLEARCRLFLEVCAAVEHAHRKGVIHRDLKPSNVLVANGSVKVIDFGVAKVTQGAADTQFTRHAQLLGTPAYMSPEQALSGGADIDTRTDVYSLGVVLYELLTGVVPIDSNRLAQSTLLEMQHILLHEEPPPPSTRLRALYGQGTGPTGAVLRSSQLEGDLDWVVMKAVRKDRNERYASVAALAEDLRRHLAGEPVSAAPPTLTYRVGKFVHRHRGAVAAVMMVALTMILGTVVSVWQAVVARRAQSQTTLTVADMYARSGLAAAATGDSARAALWFANAARIAQQDPDRREANRVRAEAWKNDFHPPIRALQTGYAYSGDMSWNPLGHALIVSADGQPQAQIWDLNLDQVWKPGFPAPVEKAAWHPSGKQLAASMGSDLVVMEYPSGKEVARRSCGPVSSLGFNSTGAILAVGSHPPDLWDWKTGAKQALALTNQSPHDLRFSRDGKWILIGWPGMVGFCSVGRPDVFAHPPLPVKAPALAGFLENGAEFFLDQESRGVDIHSTATGELIEPFAIASSALNPVAAASPDGRFIARVGSPLIDRKTQAPTDFPRHKNVIGSLAFSPDGAWLASGGYDDALRIWSLPSGNPVEELGPHQSTVRQLSFSPDGTLLASAEAGLVRIWRLAKAPAIRSIATGASSLISLSRDGRHAVPSGFTQNYSSLTRTWVLDVVTGKPIGPELSPGGVIMDAALSPDERWLAIAVSTTTNRAKTNLALESGTGNLQFWDPWSGQRLGEPIPLPAEPRGLAVHPSGKLVGVCCNSGYGVEVDAVAHDLKVLFHHHKNHAAWATLMNGRCAYSPDGKLFAMWGYLEYLHLWDREQDRELIEPYRFDATCSDLSFSGNGSVVSMAWVSRTNRLEFLDLTTRREAAPGISQSGWPFLGRFSADGRYLLTTSRDRSGRVWDWQKGTLVCPALPHDDEVMAGTFIRGTPWLATGGHDGQIKFWDPRTGMLMAPAVHRRGMVLDLQTTPNGGTMIACGQLGGAIEFLNLKQLLPEPSLKIEDAQLLAEINAAAQVHPGGDLVPLTTEDWLERWQSFRRLQPDYAGHRLTLDPMELRAWHEDQGQKFATENPGAAKWHRDRLVVSP